MIASLASLMVELKSVQALSLTCTTRVVSSQNTCLYTSTFGKANTPLVTCHPVHFEVKSTPFYLFLFKFYYFHFVFLLLLFRFYYFGFLSRFRGFRVGSVGFRLFPGRFRVVPGRFRVVPAGSGRFRVGSVFYIYPRFSSFWSKGRYEN